MSYFGLENEKQQVFIKTIIRYKYKLNKIHSIIISLLKVKYFM